MWQGKLVLIMHAVVSALGSACDRPRYKKRKWNKTLVISLGLTWVTMAGSAPEPELLLIS
jgi:hypothetical protein